MRVALTFSGCHRRGGVERVMLEGANFLQGRGHEIHAYASDLDGDALHPGVIGHHVSVPEAPRLAHLLAFIRQCRRDVSALQPAPDVLGSFGVVSPPGGVMWVQSVHKAWLRASRRHRGPLGRLKQWCNPFHPVILMRERYHFSQRRYKKLIALTDQVKADLMDLYGVPGWDIVVLPNGYSPEEFNLELSREKRPAMRERLGFGETDRVVVFVANELERKGFGPLLRAVASLNDSHVHLLVVGKVKLGAYSTEIKRLGLSERVRCVGPTSTVADFYAAADVFALPTQYEAWGLVIVEAMACGLPVLTSRLAGAAIVVQEGRTGELLDDPQDVGEIASKLQPLLAERRFSGAEVSDSVAEYTWTRVLSRYEQILAECARPAVSGPAS